MVLPAYVALDSSLSSSQAAGRTGVPVGRQLGVRLTFTRGRLIPSIRCMLVAPHEQLPGARLAPAAAGSPRASAHWAWPGARSTSAWVARTKALAVALADTQKAWGTHSLQTLQRVGSIIRSTSQTAIAALGTSAAADAKQQSSSQPPQHSPGGGDGGPGERGPGGEQQLKASLRRFLTTASRGELAQAAMFSDLSNIAYDVSDLTTERLAQAHGLTLVAHSRSAAAAAAAAAAAQEQHASLAPAPRRQPEQPPRALPAATAGMGMAQPQRAQPQQARPLAPAGAAPWPAPPLLLLQQQQPAASMRRSSSGGSLGSASAPASPRAPLVLSSFAEDTEGGPFAAPEVQATASGQLPELGTPRRPSAAAAAAAAAAGGGVAVSSAGGGGLPASPLASSSSLGSALLAQQHSWEQLAGAQQQGSSNDAQAALQELQQQEAAVLLEMKATQQLMELMQTEAAIMQQLSLQEQHGGSSIAGGASASPADAWRPQPASAGAAGSALEGVPADWFCCDGPGPSGRAGGDDATRYFVIQGSITLEHWRINLTIDPCDFEGGALGGIKVHRGVYQAALQMYAALEPLVREHIAAHPAGRIAFTGHSLGGSLATLLMLLLVHRGVLPPANVASVRTFGAPAVFCEGATGCPPAAGACQSCSLPCQHRAARVAAAAAAGGGAAPGSLLSRLGLEPDSVVNVIMTRDIVPRAFVCDYTLVADVLKSWLPSFKDHSGLAACRDHKALYNFIGTLEVLQPSLDCGFVLPDEGHSMLPPEAALYKLTEPSCPLPPRAGEGHAAGEAPGQAPAAAQAQGRSGRRLSKGLGSFGSLGSLASLGSLSLTTAIAELTSSFTLTTPSASSGGGVVAVPVAAGDAAGMTAADAAAPASPAAAEPAPEAAADPLGLTLGDAILTFANSPHPLETLGEMRAYGPNGQISRFHNPNSYTLALQALARA